MKISKRNTNLAFHPQDMYIGVIFPYLLLLDEYGNGFLTKLAS